MKYLIAILLFCVPALAATKYPAYTDNANATTFTGGATNFATVANLGSLSNSIPAGTNIATLNGTNVFTGTNRFTGNVIITNAASTISGNGAGLTNLNASSLAAGTVPDARISSTFATAANLTTVSNTVAAFPAATNVATLAGNNSFAGNNTLNAATLFNSGVLSRVLVRTNLTWTNNVTGAASAPPAWTNCAQVATLTLPALYGTNSIVRITLLRGVNATVAASVYPVFYAGTSPTFVGASSSLGTSATTNLIASAVIFKNQGAFTNQIINLGGSQSTTWTSLASAANTSGAWQFYVGMSHSSGTGTTVTNIWAREFMVEEVFAP